MLKIAKSMRFNIQGEDSLQRRRQSTWCFLNGIRMSDSSAGVIAHTFASFGLAVRAKARDDEPHGPVSPAWPHFCLWCDGRGRRARRNTRGNGAYARPRISPASKMARCARPLCHLPDAAPPRIRGIRRVGRVAALGMPRIAPRERQVEISNVLPATSAKNRCISQPVARALCKPLCLPPV